MLRKSYTKKRNGPFRPAAIIVFNSNNMTYLLGLMIEIHWKIAGSKRPVSVLYASFARSCGKVHLILLWIRIKFLFQLYKSSLPMIILCLQLKICLVKTNDEWIKWPVTHTPQCTSPISYNAPFIWAQICCKIVHCGLFLWCAMGCVRDIN